MANGDRREEAAEVAVLFEGLREHRNSRMFFADFPWLTGVVRGDWSAIPEDLEWRDSIGLAMMINGWELWENLGRGTFEDASRYAFPLKARARASGRWEGGAIDLWMAVFLLWRAHDHGWHWGEEEVPTLNNLCRTLRGKLQQLPPYRDPGLWLRDVAEAIEFSTEESLLSALQEGLQGHPPVDSEVWARHWAEPIQRLLQNCGRYSTPEQVAAALSEYEVVVIALTNNHAPRPTETALKQFAERVRPELRQAELIEERRTAP